MIHIEHREMQRSNGLIDDFVVYGSPDDYNSLASRVRSAVGSGEPEIVHTSSRIGIEIQIDPELSELFTSLQNQDNLYPTKSAWAERNILRVAGGKEVLEALSAFFTTLVRAAKGTATSRSTRKNSHTQ
jgi:hypothetical protein